ncbi:MAG: hypothetical protein ACPIOQ_26140, partial [Promethearchaeia archaeon]
VWQADPRACHAKTKEQEGAQHIEWQRPAWAAEVESYTKTSLGRGIGGDRQSREAVFHDSNRPEGHPKEAM